jgi:hypothetical protein
MCKHAVSAVPAIQHHHLAGLALQRTCASSLGRSSSCGPRSTCTLPVRMLSKKGCFSSCRVSGLLTGLCAMHSVMNSRSSWLFTLSRPAG